MTITKERLSELFIYDKEQGKIFWKNDHSGKIKAGREAGCYVHSGVVVRFDNKLHRLSKIVWCFETGIYPDKVVKTKDKNVHNCKFSNLYIPKKQRVRIRNKKVSTEWLLENIEYNPNTGEFKGKYKDFNIRKTSENYLMVYLEGRDYCVHRLIWQIMTGTPPKDKIDHINCIRSDNRWKNLREANSHENGCNRVSRKKTASGFKNVYYNKEIGMFRAHIMKYGKQFHLGYFATADAAHSEYVRASEHLHGEFSNPGFLKEQE